MEMEGAKIPIRLALGPIPVCAQRQQKANLFASLLLLLPNVCVVVVFIYSPSSFLVSCTHNHPLATAAKGGGVDRWFCSSRVDVSWKKKKGIV